MVVPERCWCCCGPGAVSRPLAAVLHYEKAAGGLPGGFFIGVGQHSEQRTDYPAFYPQGGAIGGGGGCTADIGDHVGNLGRVGQPLQ